MTGIRMILGAGVLALEEELEFWCQVWNTRRGFEDRGIPVSSHGRITSIDPPRLGAFVDGEVHGPLLLRASTRPHVVFVSSESQRSAIPGRQLSGSGQPEVPPTEPGVNHHGLGTADTHVEVIVVAPLISQVEFKSMTTTDPPLE